MTNIFIAIFSYEGGVDPVAAVVAAGHSGGRHMFSVGSVEGFMAGRGPQTFKKEQKL